MCLSWSRNINKCFTKEVIWSDVLDDMDQSTWYYLAVQEATNSHLYKNKGELNETWTEMAPDLSWENC